MPFLTLKPTACYILDHWNKVELSCTFLLLKFAIVCEI
jgi:hypothetical protein